MLLGLATAGRFLNSKNMNDEWEGGENQENDSDKGPPPFHFIPSPHGKLRHSNVKKPKAFWFLRLPAAIHDFTCLLMIMLKNDNVVTI